MPKMLGSFGRIYGVAGCGYLLSPSVQPNHDTSVPDDSYLVVAPAVEKSFVCVADYRLTDGIEAVIYVVGLYLVIIFDTRIAGSQTSIFATDSFL